MYLKLNDIFNVASGQKSTLDVLASTRGYVIDSLDLLLTNITKAQLLDVVIRANKNAIIQDSGLRIDGAFRERGQAVNPNILTLDFTEPTVKEFVQQYMGSLDTVQSGVQTLSLELQLDTGLTNPRVDVWANLSLRPTQLDATADQISKRFHVPQAINGSSARQPVTVPFDVGSNALIKRVHFVPSATLTINAVEIRKNNAIIFDRNALMNNYILSRNGKVAQPNWFTVDFIEDNNFFGKAIPMTDVDSNGNRRPANVQYYLDVTATAPGTVEIVVEYVDTLNGD